MPVVTRPLFQMHDGNPTWEDVQKGRAVAVRHGKYSRDCTRECMWSDDVHSGKCYLFAEEIAEGKCPSSMHLEWAAL